MPDPVFKFELGTGDHPGHFAHHIGRCRQIVRSANTKDRHRNPGCRIAKVPITKRDTGSDITLHRGAHQHVAIHRGFKRTVTAICRRQPPFDDGIAKNLDATFLDGIDPRVPAIRTAKFRRSIAKDQAANTLWRQFGDLLRNQSTDGRTANNNVLDAEIIQKPDQVIGMQVDIVIRPANAR